LFTAHDPDNRLSPTARLHTIRGTHAQYDQINKERSMNIKPIRSLEDLTAASARVQQLWGAEIGSSEGDELEILALLIEMYEDEHFPMPPSDPIEAIKFRMDQQGQTPT
jgi:HTH-type transcriptional regulator/antitoxin HigA